MTQPQEVFEDLVKFMLNIDQDIKHTKLGRYLQIALSESRPQNYTPRVGKINSSFEKYSPKLLEIVKREASQQMERYGYLKYLEGQNSESEAENDQELKIYYAENGIPVSSDNTSGSVKSSKVEYISEFNKKSDQMRLDIKKGKIKQK